MKKIFFGLIFFSAFASAQVTPDATIKSNTNTLIRNATTVTRSNHALIDDQIVNAKASRVEIWTASGTDTYTVSVDWVTAYTNGLTIPNVKFTNANTGAATINVNSLGAISLKKNGTTALIAGDVSTGQVFDLLYDGTNFQVKGTGGSVTGTSVGGDLSGTLPNPTVVKINGTQLSGLGTGILKNTTGTGVPSIAVAGDFPTLNQNSTGSSATLTTPRAIYGNNFDGSAALTQIIVSTYGGTGNGFAKFSGPASTEKTFTLPNANATLHYDGGPLGTPSSGTATNLTGLPLSTGITGFGANWLSPLQTTLGSGWAGAFASTYYTQRNTQISSYTLVLSDGLNTTIEMNVGGANNLTIPLNSSVPFAIGTQITIVQYGIGLTTVVGIGGVTIRSSSGIFTSPGQYSPMIIEKRGTDEWYLWNGGAIIGQALTKTDDTNVTLTLGGSANSSLLAASSITAGWTGTLASLRGGTGAANIGSLIWGSDNITFTTSGTTSLTFPTSGTIQTSPAWTLSNGGTLSGPNTITGTTTNIIKFSFANLAVTNTDGAGLWLQNSTAAVLGTNQNSPQITFEGQGWSTGGSITQSIKFREYVAPTQQNPAQGSLNFEYSQNGGTWNNALKYDIGTVLLTIGLGNSGIQSSGILSLYSNNQKKAQFSLLGNLSIGSNSELGNIYAAQSALSSGWLPILRLDPGAHTLMTQTTAFPNIIVNTVTQKWVDGTVADQSNVWIKSPTWDGTTTLATFTLAENLKVDAPIAGTKGLFGANNAIWSNGGLKVSGTFTIDDGFNISIGTGTGTQIATSTSQKLGYFGAVPVVQPSAVTTVQGFVNAMNSLGLIASSTINILDGTYTPSLTNVTNVTASTAYVTGYYRLGNSVTVYGKISINSTLAANTATEVAISLPISSNLVNEEDLGGTAVSDALASETARIKADAANDRASVTFKSISISNDSYSFEFSYQVK